MQQVRYATHWRNSSRCFGEHRRHIATHLFGRSAGSVWPARLLERLPTLWARALRDVMERRAASELYRLNDHLLRDIGLDRVCVRSGGIRAVSNALRLR